MYPSGSGANLPGPSGSAPGSSRRAPGTRISLEGISDWDLKLIDFAGNEKYKEPLDYEDEVHERSFLIDWKKVLGTEMDYVKEFKPLLYVDKEDPIEIEQDAPVPKEQQVVPEAGPWHGVAKNLHESLLQINVFLDNLNVLKDTEYMAALTILDPNQSELQPELPNQNRAAQWVWKRKALQDAANVLEMSIRRMEQSGIETRDNPDFRKRQQFFQELRKMREYWRIRKVGDHITGDLGYKIFGKKYNPRQIFDISRRSDSYVYNESDLSRVGDRYEAKEFHSILQVQVPRDLARRATLSVSIVDDKPGEENLFPEINEKLFESMRLEAKSHEQLHWNNVLNWAQETLICREAFSLLCSDAGKIKTRRSIIRDGVLVTSLGGDKLLKICLQYFPFREMHPTIEDYLNRCLKQIFVAAQCNRLIRPQVFVSLPLTQLHEQLDFRGPKAFSQLEIDERNRPNDHFLSKMCKVASHYNLMQLVISTLKEIIANDLDPYLQFRFMRCTQTYTIIVCTMSNKYYEQVFSKQTFYIRISDDEIFVNSPNNFIHEINCHQSRHELLNAIRGLMTQYLASSVVQLAKGNWLFLLVQFNANNVADDGHLAPTVYLYNEITTRSIMLKFFVNRVPEIQVKKLIHPIDKEIPFVKLNFKRLAGSSTMRKFDNLFSLFRESDGCGPVDEC